MSREKLIRPDARSPLEPVSVRTVQAVDDPEAVASIGLHDNDRWHPFPSSQSFDRVRRPPIEWEVARVFQVSNIDLDQAVRRALGTISALFQARLDVRIIEPFKVFVRNRASVEDSEIHGRSMAASFEPALLLCQ